MSNANVSQSCPVKEYLNGYKATVFMPV